MTTNPPAARLAWALDCVHTAQARLTPVRRSILRFLALQTLPVTLAQIGHGKTLLGKFDDATVYRTLVFFVELEIVRQIHLHGRQTHFLLNAPGECSTFLVCRCCGVITPVPHPPALHELEELVAEAHSYRSVTHNLELHGVCPTCHEHTHHCVKPSKLTPGLRLRGRFVK